MKTVTTTELAQAVHGNPTQAAEVVKKAIELLEWIEGNLIRSRAIDNALKPTGVKKLEKLDEQIDVLLNRQA